MSAPRPTIRHLAPLALLLAALTGCSSSPGYRETSASLASFGLHAGKGVASDEAPVEAAAPRAGGWAVNRGAGAPGRGADERIARIDDASTRITEQQILDQYAEAPSSGDDPPVVALVEVSYDAGVQVARPVPPDDLAAFESGAGGDSGPFRAVQTVPEFLMPSRLSWNALRYCAARSRADHLLLLTRATERYDYNNGWSNLYLTIVGLFVVPGNSLEVHTAVEAALVDVRSGKILGVVSAGHKSHRSILALSDEVAHARELVRENADELFAQLGRQTAKRVR